MRLPDPHERGFAFTAAGTAARVNGALTSELYEALRAQGPCGFAEDAIKDTLTFVPFRDLPPWFKWWKVRSAVRDKIEGWWLRSEDTVVDAWRALRGNR
ncbi:hypothetical protein [Streptomyces sp. NPDC001480]|uniref:hypothetical protein n=1 Tax=Streptomyces sp. NPDC001480 TaxID=3364577 RepID=UPI0036C86785